MYFNCLKLFFDSLNHSCIMTSEIFKYHAQKIWTEEDNHLSFTNSYAIEKEKEKQFREWTQWLYQCCQNPREKMVSSPDLWNSLNEWITGEKWSDKDCLEKKLAMYHTWNQKKSRGETIVEGVKMPNWKKIQKWFIKGVFDSEKEILSYVQWVSDMWNISFFILSYDLFVSLMNSQSIRDFSQMPFFYRSTMKSPYQPTFVFFHKNGSWFFLLQNPFLPTFLQFSI